MDGVTFKITRVEDASHSIDRTTQNGGEIFVEGLEPGVYSVTETATLPDHVLDTTEYHVELSPGKTSELRVQNDKRPYLTISKVEQGSGKPIPGTVFTVEGIDSDYRHDVTTGTDGTVTIQVDSGSYRITEKDVPEPYCLPEDEPDRVQTVSLNPNDNKTLTFKNSKKPLLTISKIDADTQEPILGTVFTVEGIDSDYRHDVTTGADGTVTIMVDPGSYRITEQNVPEPYCLPEDEADRVQTVSLNPNDNKTLTFKNSKKPLLTISKIDADTQEPVPGTVFRVEAVNGDYQGDWTTGADGKVAFRVEPGTYRVTEKSVPAPYFLPDKDADRVQTISLNAGDEKTLTFRNRKMPELTIYKEDSVAGAPIEGAKFHVTFTSNGEAADAPGTIDFGEILTNANGQIRLHEQGKRLYPGEYTVTEVAPAPGFQMKEPTTQKIIIHGSESETLTFQNVPLNAIIVEKRDSVTGAVLPGAVFQLRYLDGTSGTGGTVIGQKVTGRNGIAIWTGLESGAYVLEEVSAPDGYTVLQASETVFLAADGEQSVITVRFENAPAGSLLIRKVCSVTPSVTLSGAEFKVAYADGTFIGDSNGVFISDENGEVRISGLIPGKSVIVTETKAPVGFIIDTQSQIAQIKEGKTVSLTFRNQPKGAIVVQKRDSQTGQPLPGAEFRITTAAGCEVGLDGVIGTSTMTQNSIFTTDSNGEIRISNLAPGTYVLTETKAPAGYVMDAPSTNVVIGTNGDTQTVVITNTRKGALIVEKYDSVTKQPLAGAQFKITTASGEFVPDNEGLTSSNGLYTTNAEGQIVLSKLLPGTYIVTEVKAPDNYRADPTPQTVVVSAGDTQTVRFYDDPLCTLTILKRDAVTRKPLARAEFIVRDSDGRAFGPNNGRYVTGTDGTVTVTGLAPNATYVVSESKAPTGYIRDETPKNIVVRTGVANSLVFDDEPATTLVIQKFVDGTANKPLAGVEFLVTDSSGAVLGPNNGYYTTDKDGRIVIEGLEPGVTVTARETKTLEGYILDATPKSIKIKAGAAQSLTFWNKRAGELVVRKLDKLTGKPLSGAQFQLTYAGGGYVDNANGHLSSNGLYTTNANGEIRISGVTGTIVAREVKAAPGYIIDLGTQTQTVTVNPADTQTLTFYNAPEGGLELIKVSESDRTQRIPNTTFEIRRMDGSLVETVTTDKQGRVHVDLDAGDYYAVEIEAAKGFKLDATPHYFTVEDGRTTTLTITNKAYSGILIHKTDSMTGKEIYGVTFLLYDSTMTPIGQYVSDSNGFVYIEGLTTSGRYYLRELDTPGYIVDTQMKTVYVTAGETTLVEWKNIPITGQIQIVKKSADYNPTNGLPAGTLLEGAVFEIYDKAGNLVDTIRSDSRGLAVSKQLPLGRYFVREVKAPEHYSVTANEMVAYLDFAGQIVRFEVTNKSVSTGVSITKTGPKEALSGQPVRYVFSGIANTSNVALGDFYWRDTLPVEARLDTVVTGTYNFTGSYKIMYRVNGGVYRTLADNLSTQKNYTLTASPVALGLTANERVTEIIFIFGQVPAGFSQMENSRLQCIAVCNNASDSFVNVADVGGTYDGAWVQSVSRWVTVVYKRPITSTLPRTGY